MSRRPVPTPVHARDMATSPGDIQFSSVPRRKSPGGYLRFSYRSRTARYITKKARTRAGDPDVFLMVELHLPVSTSVHQTSPKSPLTSPNILYRGKLLASWWTAQPWFSDLHRWHANPPRLDNTRLTNSITTRLRIFCSYMHGISLSGSQEGTLE